MADKGQKQEETRSPQPGEGMIKRVRQPIFEDSLLSSGKSVIDAFTHAIHRDDQALIDACLYIGQMEAAGRDSNGNISQSWQARIQVALYKLNGTMAIDGRARDEAVQAHVGVFFPRHASNEDKKRLETMQYKHRDDGNEDNGNRNDHQQR